MTKIRWTGLEKAQILGEAARIKLAEPVVGDLALMRRAVRVLPQERQREIPSIAGPSYDWFRISLEAAVAEAKEAREQVQRDAELAAAERRNEANRQSLADRAALVEGRIAERATAEIADNGPPTLRLEEPRWVPANPSRPVEVPPDSRPGVPRTSGLEDSPAAGQAEVAIALVGLIGRFGHLVDAATRLVNDGVTISVSIGRSGAPPRAAAAAVAPAAPARVAPIEVARVPPPVTTPAPAPATPPAARKVRVMRRARVAVLSLESGHQKHGLLEGLKGKFERLECLDTPKKPPAEGMFASFDFVVCTKYTPTYFVHDLKAVLPAKVRVAQGNVPAIVDALRHYPEVEVEVEAPAPLPG